MTITFDLGNERLSAKLSPHAGETRGRRFVNVTKDFASDNDGAFQLVKIIRPIATFFKPAVDLNFGAYINTASLYFGPVAGISFFEKVYEVIHSRDFRISSITDFVSKTIDFGYNSLCVVDFFGAAFWLSKTPFAFTAGMWAMALLDDAADFACSVVQCVDSCRRARTMAAYDTQVPRVTPEGVVMVPPPIPQPIRDAIANDFRDSVIHIARTTAAVAASIFLCAQLFTGAALIPVTCMVVFGVAAASLKIFSYYHKNFYCDRQLGVAPLRQ